MTAARSRRKLMDMAFTFRLMLLALTIAALTAAPASASYSYDANGRLLTATGPWGTGGAQAAGSYVYDALGNVRSWTQGAKTGTVGYGDATNRVTAYAKTGEATRSFSYDARGNTTGNGDNSFTYDFANQPVSVGPQERREGLKADVGDQIWELAPYFDVCRGNRVSRKVGAAHTTHADYLGFRLKVLKRTSAPSSQWLYTLSAPSNFYITSNEAAALSGRRKQPPAWSSLR
jgi:hypothetical protein